MTRVILVRHGQTEWNRVERFRGLTDIELNETGHRQAQAIAQRLRRREIHAIYSGPLKRALQTAQPIAEVQGLEVQSVQGLNDMDYGAWTGLSPEEVATEYTDLYQTLLDSPHLVQLPAGESLSQVRARSMEALERICLRHESETVVLVSHQVVNRVLVCAIFGLSNASFWQIAQDNAAINIFEAQKREYRILLLNDTCHLES
jgi:broad specificity phosphatase PhoE